LEPVGIGAELNRIVALVSEEYQKKGLNIDLQENIEKAFVQIDCVQLKSAIINILENSVKYKNKELANMEITCREDEKNIFISFSDNGPGVSGEALDDLFDIFYRGDPSRSNPSKGSGLGLAITAKILERLDGSIWAENGSGGGLSIVMRLPKIRGGDGLEKNSDC